MQSNSPYKFKASPYSSHTKLLALLQPPGNGKRVLDVGCGPGYLSDELLARGYRVTGLEHPRFAPTGAEFELIAADLEQGLPTEVRGPFDFILCADILEHLRQPEELLRQLGGVLAPGGKLIASLPNSGNLYFRLVVLSGRFPKEEKGLFDRTHVHFFTWDGWNALLAGSGLKLQQVDPTGIPVGLAIGGGSEPGLAIRSAEWLSYTLARLRKQLFAYQFIVVAGK